MFLQSSAIMSLQTQFHYAIDVIAKIKISKLNKKTNSLSFSIVFFLVAKYTVMASVCPDCFC